MLVEINLLTKDRIIEISILLSYLIIFLLFFIFDIKWLCPFQKIFNIACPGCGLTRAFKAIMNLELITALKYNLLSIPLFIFIIISIIMILKDFIKKENKFLEKMNNIFKDNYIIIIFILVIVTIINNM